MSKFRIAPKGQFRLIGSDAHSLWIIKNFKIIKAAKMRAEKERGCGYYSVSIYNDVGKRIYFTGFSCSIDNISAV